MDEKWNIRPRVKMMCYNLSLLKPFPLIPANPCQVRSKLRLAYLSFRIGSKHLQCWKWFLHLKFFFFYFVFFFYEKCSLHFWNSTDDGVIQSISSFDKLLHFQSNGDTSMRSFTYQKKKVIQVGFQRIFRFRRKIIAAYDE